MSTFIKLLLMGLLVNISQQESDLILFAKKIDDDKYNVTCVSDNFETAIAWITPFTNTSIVSINKKIIPENTHVYNSKYVTAKNKNSSEMLIKDWETSDNTGNNTWRFKNSLDYNLGPVLDYRWEELSITITPNETPYYSINKNSRINFSIRLQNTSIAQLVVYHRLNNNNTELRILWEDNKLQVHCDKATNSTSIEYTKGWYHFSVTQQNNAIIIWQETQQLLSCAIFFEPEVFRINSNGTVEWKIHKYNFLFGTSTEPINLEIGPNFGTDPKYICMNYFWALCDKCNTTMSFILNDRRNSAELNRFRIAYKKDVNTLPYIKWEYHRYFNTPAKPNLKGSIFVEKNAPSTDRPFFGLDIIGRCNENEKHKSTITIEEKHLKGVKCYILDQTNRKISIKDPTTNVPERTTICDTTTNNITDSCKYNLIDIFLVDQREYLKACISKNGNSFCFCLAGYYGKDCSQKCGAGTWGNNCNNFCSEGCVQNECNNINGNCTNGCRNDEFYSGDKCDLRFPIIKDEPRFLNITPNSVVIEFNVTNFEKGKNDTVIKYVLEVAQKPNITGMIPENNSILQLIGELQKSTDYDVKIILLYKNDTHNPRAVKTVLFKTNCYIQTSPDDFEINPSNTTVEVRLKNTTDGCENGQYQIDIQPHDAKTFTLSQLHYVKVYTEKLQPYKKYQMTICKTNPHVKFTKEFTTTPGAPPPVEVIVYSKSETRKSISLKWESKRENPNGEIDSYLIEYQGSSHPYEKKQLVILATQYCPLYDMFVCGNIENLVENVDYTITISGKNKGTDYWGRPSKSIKANIKETASSEPINCTFNGTILSWYHPVTPNGDLKSFKVTFQAIKNDERQKNIQDNKSKQVILQLNGKYEKNYSISLDEHISKLNEATTYKMTLKAVGKVEGNEAEIYPELVTPPPKAQFTKNGSLSKDQTNTSLVIEYPETDDFSISTQCKITILVAEVSEKPSSTNKDLKCRNVLHEPERYDHKIIQENEGCSFKNASSKHFAIQNTTDFKYNLNGKYFVTVIYTNTYESKSVHSNFTMTYPENLVEDVSESSLLFLLILLIIPACVLGYFAYKYKEELGIKLLGNAANDGESMAEIAPKEKNGGFAKPPTNPLKPSTPPVISKRRSRQFPAAKEDDPAKPLLSLRVAVPQHSRPIAKADLENYVREITKPQPDETQSGELFRQLQLLKRNQAKPWDYGILKENKTKNRYLNLMPYDYNRVKLPKINDDPYSDYINASYIDGYNVDKAYIATQGPKPSTLFDFWRMAWQENVHTIVMLANIIEGGKKKTEQYWPNLKDSVTHGDITISHDSTKLYADFEYREFSVTRKGETRSIHHMHFTGWPDHGVPMYSQSLVPFLKKLLTIPQTNSPIIVHCSAGVGRTGTIILCDMALRMVAQENKVDFLGLLSKIREQRVNMVDNTDQYKLAHMVILDCLSPGTTIECNRDFEKSVRKLLEDNGTQQQLKYLTDTAWRDELETTPLVLPQENAVKNRNNSILPDNYGRIYLQRYPLNDENSDYINAVSVDGFRLRGRFVATQLPLPNTMGDFWRMIVEKNINVVVSLNEIKSDDLKSRSGKFWPEKASAMIPVDFITLQQISRKSFDTHEIIKIEMTVNNAENEPQKCTVSIVQVRDWAAKAPVPETVGSLLKVYAEVGKLSRNENPILVTCHDGCRASGLFIGLSFVVEKIKLEQQCDVCLAVRTIRRSRRQFITDIKQFNFLYYVAVNYLDQFAIYSNFQT